jgi:hypothetical protein
MSVASSGECSPGKTCGGFANLKCAAGLSCNYVVPNVNVCGAPDLGGTCWGMPNVCPMPVGFGPQTRACMAAQCTGECDLIKSGKTWYPDNSCPQ